MKRKLYFTFLFFSLEKLTVKINEQLKRLTCIILLNQVNNQKEAKKEYLIFFYINLLQIILDSCNIF